MTITSDFNERNELKASPVKRLIFGLNSTAAVLANAAFGERSGGSYYWAAKEQFLPFLSKFDVTLRELESRDIEATGADFGEIKINVCEAINILLLQGRLDVHELTFHAPLIKEAIDQLPADISQEENIRHFVDLFNQNFEFPSIKENQVQP